MRLCLLMEEELEKHAFGSETAMSKVFCIQPLLGRFVLD
jgi:hypothetical protein